MKTRVVFFTGIVGLAAVLMLALISCPSPSHGESEPDWNLYGIQITRGDGVDIDQMRVVHGYIERFFRDLGNVGTAMFQARITNINVVTGNALNKTGNIFTIGTDKSYSDIYSYGCDIIDDLVLRQFDNSRETIRLSMGRIRIQRGA